MLGFKLNGAPDRIFLARLYFLLESAYAFLFSILDGLKCLVIHLQRN